MDKKQLRELKTSEMKKYKYTIIFNTEAIEEGKFSLTYDEEQDLERMWDQAPKTLKILTEMDEDEYLSLEVTEIIREIIEE